ncbi:HlyD family efflux transporter periplasmic adaptor subunit [Dysgonomonas capnocytophagoides]|uniref:HlyD family efflux transporter periplasmic adaptor subunit n=1 Tax=Dysgonomonas capnocytophagoides TaxID=45254 RepID=A0A4Y8L5C6_9BACT|nr:HlyD family efflux transporter periplasmic adaptor subunit [Dysgonomonas capnocytophagoides]TFD97845.1 HlyD family efflux transporter periplasmic adaptor subunit [Dysgonomonas capnocytophagoides]
MYKGKDDQLEIRSREFQEVLGNVPPWVFRYGLSLMFFLVFIILVGCAIFKYPDTINATLTLTSTTPTVSLIAKTSGRLKDFYVVDKQFVSAGQYLAVVDNPSEKNDILFLKKYLYNLLENTDEITYLPPKNLKLGDMQSLYSSFYIALSDYLEFKRLKYYEKKNDFMDIKLKETEEYYEALKNQKKIVERQFLISQKQYERDSLLNRKGILSDEELEISTVAYLQANMAAENIHSSLKNTGMQITQTREGLLDAEYQYQDRKHTLETSIKTYVEQVLTQIQMWEQIYVFVSPIDGIVSFTSYSTKNQNVISGENIFNVIPNITGELLGKASIPMYSSGNVMAGQNVHIRFFNFPDIEYGMVRGVVKTISIVPSKSNEDKEHYIVEVSFPNGLVTAYNKKIKYQPEMKAQAEIITQEISVLERFFMPLRKIWTESLK